MKPLPPMKYSCLRALAQGPLEWRVLVTEQGCEAGWRSTVGVRGLWNSHTVLWLANCRGYCVATPRGTATITPAGRGVAQTMEAA